MHKSPRLFSTGFLFTRTSSTRLTLPRIYWIGASACMKLLAGCCAVVALALGSGCTYIEGKEREFIWRPAATVWWPPFDVKANGVEELWIARNGEAVVSTAVANEGAALKSTGDRLHAWWWPNVRADAPVMLYLHGARWNLEGNAFRIARFRNMGFSVLAIDYRGFGKTGGDLPSEVDACADAAIAWEYLKTRVPEAARRFIYGHSLGGAIAIELASRHDDLAGIIVESTFTTILDMAGTYTLLRFLPISLILSQHYDSLSRIEKVRVPKLFVHGTRDAFVPSWMAERLYARATGEKRMLIVDGANHSNASGVGFEQYRVALQEFFQLRPPRDAGIQESGRPTTQFF